MWISDKWKDFELIDCSRGERLERWGDVFLVRPDPQVIWKTPRKHPGWDNPNAGYIRSEGGGGKWKIRSLPGSWKICYGGLAFNIKAMNFKHTGIFPEQAANWDYITDKIKSANRPVSVLNLFAYTGAATAAAARAGASVCHVDSAKGMVAIARDNIAASGLAGRPVRLIVDDCLRFIRREIKRGRRYDAVIMDPPSYGRGPSGEIWKLEENLWQLAEAVSDALSGNPLFVLISSYTSGLSPGTLKYIADSVFTAKFKGRSESGELGLPVTESGLALPCGASCRWERKCLAPESSRHGKTTLYPC